MAQQVLTWGDARGDGYSPGGVLTGQHIAAPRRVFALIVAHLVDFDPDGAGLAFEGGAGRVAFGHVSGLKELDRSLKLAI